MLVKLKDVCTFESNNFNKKDNWTFVNYLDTSNLTENVIQDFQYLEDLNNLPSRAKRKVKIGDILFSSVRPNQKHYGFIDKEYPNLLVSTGFIVLTPTEKVNNKFLYYWLIQDKTIDILQTKAETNTSAYPSITKEDMYALEIDLPPLEIQDKIANILSDIDNQIERNNAMTKRLQVLAQTTYSRWFNQFEFPNNEGKSYKSNGGEFIYNKELDKEIPKDWEVKHLTDIVKWESASQPPKKVFKYEYQEGYIRFIQNRDYENDNHLTFIPLTKNTKLCNNTDIMMDKYGDAGCVRFGLEGAYNVALAKIFTLIPNSQEYIRKYLEQESTYNYLHSACIASTRASLNESLLQNLIILLPNKQVLEKFEKIQKNILYQILNIKKNNQELNKLKEKLLPLLINGQLNI